MSCRLGRRLTLPVTVSHGGAGGGAWRCSSAGEAQTTGRSTEANHLTNNRGFNDLFEMGVASSGHIRGLKGASFTRVRWTPRGPHSVAQNQSHHASEGCGDGRRCASQRWLLNS